MRTKSETTRYYHILYSRFSSPQYLQDIRVIPRGVRLTFGGYNDKLEDFANYVSNQISADLKNILPKDEAEFDRYKDILIRGLEVSIFEER